jgi:hypothetical protein
MTPQTHRVDEIPLLIIDRGRKGVAMAWEAGTKAFGSLATASLELQSAEGFNGCSSERPKLCSRSNGCTDCAKTAAIVSSEKPRSPATLPS